MQVAKGPRNSIKLKLKFFIPGVVLGSTVVVGAGLVVCTAVLSGGVLVGAIVVAWGMVVGGRLVGGTREDEAGASVVACGIVVHLLMPRIEV